MTRPSRQSNRAQATLQRTVIGPLSADEGNTEIPCAFTLLRNPNHYFAISGNNLVTAQSGGWLRVNTRSNALAMSATPTVWTMAALAPPLPSAITLTPASVTVANVDDQQHRFLRHLGLDIVTARALTSADDGPQLTVITASQGGQSLSMSFQSRCQTIPSQAAPCRSHWSFVDNAELSSLKGVCEGIDP
jgi:hypothetical protein